MLKPYHTIHAGQVLRGDAIIVAIGPNGEAVTKLVVGTSLAMPATADRIAVLFERVNGKTPVRYFDKLELITVVPGWSGRRNGHMVANYISRARGEADLQARKVDAIGPNHQYARSHAQPCLPGDAPTTMVAS